MDYQNYNNDANDSDEDYSVFVAWLSDLTAAELREAKQDPAQQKQALCRYYKRGERANLTAGELVDFLGVSYPPIFHMAGYTDDEGIALMMISDTLTAEDVREAVLPGGV